MWRWGEPLWSYTAMISFITYHSDVRVTASFSAKWEKFIFINGILFWVNLNFQN